MARTPRAQANATERRRRSSGSLDRTFNQKLGVPDEWLASGGIIDKNQWRSHWVNDEGSRIYDLTTQDDYDVVTNPDIEGDDKRVCRPVGTTKDGKPLMAYLCRKPKEFDEADQAEMLADIDARERGLLVNKNANSANADAPVYDGGVTASITRGYVP